MIVFHPDHFFKIVPIIAQGKKKHYVTPLQFVINIAALQVLLYLAFKRLYPDLVVNVFAIESNYENDLLVLGVNLLLAAASPVVIAAACALVLIIWYVSASIWPINYLAREIPFNYHGALLPLSSQTYINLDWSRYGWCLLYYYWFFYLVFPSVVLLGGYLLELMFYIQAAMEGDRVDINKLTIIPYALVLFCFALAAYRVFVPSYVGLLLRSSRALTERGLLYLVFAAERSGREYRPI